jgi:hypothetical protein
MPIVAALPILRNAGAARQTIYMPTSIAASGGCRNNRGRGENSTGLHVLEREAATIVMQEPEEKPK